MRLGVRDHRCGFGDIGTAFGGHGLAMGYRTSWSFWTADMVYCWTTLCYVS